MHRKAESWFVLGVLYVGCVYFFVLMEWIFFVTKPSFFSTASPWDKVSSLAVTPLFLLIPGVAAIALIGVLSYTIKPHFGRAFLLVIACLIPSAVLSDTVFLLIDNFTYTLFGFGIILSKSPWHLVYAVLFILFMVAFTRLFFDAARAPRHSALFRRLAVVSIILIALSAGAAAVVYATGGVESPSMQYNPSQARRPNLLILSSDALNARHLSAYGYERDTTPFLREFIKEAFVCENCFTNCAHSGGSLASLFTGRLPTTTKLIYPPDILRGPDAYRHLPGILGELGYHRFDISERHYADPYDLNMRNAFDIANFRTSRDTAFAVLPHALAERFGLQQYFLSQTFDRIESRLLHAFGLKWMINVFEEVIQRRGVVVRDEGRVKAALEFIDRKGEPFLVHLHLMGTHGPKYGSRNRLFSVGKKQAEEWMDDFYDDAILDFDGYLEEVVGYLEEKGFLDRTIVILHTDHGQKWVTHEKLPLIIRFPRGEHAGSISANVQYLDVAPTILDYMGLEIPPWMEGMSLLSGAPDPTRPIFSVSVKESEAIGNGRYAKPASFAPIEGLGTISVIICQRYFSMNFGTEQWSNRFFWCNVKEHTNPCDETDIPPREALRELLVEHLREKGFDLSKVEVPALEK
ncbi:MAG: sulfatase-like hydrolase/transferase [Deltaproteobacteria bacterium]|nr:sulfatase-like hydrolase/transferase [Deltaproteobacteria bacterium]